MIVAVRDASPDRPASRWRARLKGLVATRKLKPGDRDCVLLTFDDGPHPEGTPRVLDALRRYGARAVFFIVGSRIERAPHLLARILDEGHLLGNHSHDHASGRALGFRRYCDDLRRCQDAIEGLTGFRPALFRPPLGEMSPWTLLAPRLVGLRPIFWSIDANDWRLREAAEVEPCADRLNHQLGRRGLREIVLMHDERPLTAMLLDQVLPPLVERGVDLRRALDELAQM